MAFTILRRAVMASAIALFISPVAVRAEESGTFDMLLFGVRAATLSYAGKIERGQYAASGALRTTGLLSLVTDVGYTAQVQGRYRDNRFEPRLYRETARDDDGSYSAEMRYRAGVPQPKGYSPNSATPQSGLNPAGQAGTVDIMTVIFAVLRDQTRDAVCDVSVQMFDGVRRGQITLTQPIVKSNGQIDCSGEYRRLEGFSAQQMAERQRFPFTLTYTPQDADQFRVTRVITETTFGRVTIRRR